MEDTEKEEAVVGGNSSIRVWSNSTNAVITSCSSTSDENQNKLTGGASDWGAVTEDSRSKNPEEKPGMEPTTVSLDSSVSFEGGVCGAPGPSPSLLTSLCSLAEHSDQMLLPHSLHQIAESRFLEEDYRWAVEFLRLEQLYHERLLSNLTFLQEEWESQWKTGTEPRNSTPVKTQCSDAESKCMDSLSQICQTHQRPNRTMEKDVVDLTSTPKGEPRGDPAEWEEKQGASLPRSESEGEEEEEEEELGEVLEEELYEEFGEELEEEFGEELEGAPEDDSLMDELQEDLVKGGLPCGEEQLKLILAEQNFPSRGLVSILKKNTRRDGAVFANHSPPKDSYRHRVHFSETDDTLDNDEVGGASCLFFFLLCLVTVVISMGGTALFCLLGGAYSNVCTDFSQNMDFYFGVVRRGLDTLTYWFMSTSSPLC